MTFHVGEYPRNANEYFLSFFFTKNALLIPQVLGTIHDSLTAKKEVAERKEKMEEVFKASLKQDEIHKQLEEKVERIKVLEIENKNLKEENKELHKVKDTICSNSSGSQIEETEKVVEGGFVPVDERMLSVSRRFQNAQKKLILPCKRVWSGWSE